MKTVLFYIIALAFFINPTYVLSGPWVPLNKVVEFLKKNKKCFFSAVRIPNPKSEYIERIYKSLGWKNGMVEQYDNYTPVLCIWNGTMGEGTVLEEKGCSVAWYAIDQDRFYVIKGLYHNDLTMAVGKKCTKEVALNLLTQVKSSDGVYILPEITKGVIWDGYLVNARQKEQIVQIVYDEFGLGDVLKGIKNKGFKKALLKYKNDYKKSNTKENKSSSSANENTKEPWWKFW